MIATWIFLFLVLSTVSLSALAVLWCVVRAYNKRRLLGDVHAASSVPLDSIGISVLGSGVDDLAQVENLLTVDYVRYEVVLAIDARQQEAEFAALVARYRMISVEYASPGEFPGGQVRGLYRSRKRCYRRLVLLDCPAQSREADLDAAAGVAAYDYLLPVRGGDFLLSGAIERLVAEVGECAAGTFDVLRVCVGEPAVLLNRESVTRAGGFGAHPSRLLALRRVRFLWEPVFALPGGMRRVSRPYRAAGALLLIGGMVVALGTEDWPLLAALLTGALVWACGGYASRLIREQTGGNARLFPGWRKIIL